MLWDEIPDAVPEERQIEERMDELMRIVAGRRLPLGELLAERSKKTLIVTLLALLELSRLGMVHIIQRRRSEVLKLPPVDENYSLGLIERQVEALLFVSPQPVAAETIH